jgi:S1/P1 Nuclease
LISDLIRLHFQNLRDLAYVGLIWRNFIMICFVAFASIFTQAFAWWCDGHMLTAMIAQLDLIQNNPQAFNTASATVEVLNGPLTHNISNTFVESACWADDIKEFNIDYLDPAHYIDMPYNPEGILSTPGSTENVLGALSQNLKTLSTETLDTAPLETSLSIRFLIHILGDMHQPLHCTNMWNSDFPQGDEGGNLFTIEFDSQIKELHAFWDSAAGKLENDYPRPLSSADWNDLLQLATEIMAEWPKVSLINQLLDKSPADWCLESYNDAVNFAYNGAVLNEQLSEDYVNRAWGVVKKRLALGGYRLSSLIQELY